MSKQRAHRRAALQAERERQRRDRERRARRHAAFERLRPRMPRRRRRAKVWTRRTRAQRASVLGLALGVIVLTYIVVDSWSIRVAIFALVAIGTPALSTLAMDRSRG